MPKGDWSFELLRSLIHGNKVIILSSHTVATESSACVTEHPAKKTEHHLHVGGRESQATH